MDQPVPNVANNVESGNQSVGGSTSSQKPALSSNLKKILLVLFLIIVGIGILWAWGKVFNKKTEQPQAEQPKEDVVDTATTSANIKAGNPAINLSYNVSGIIESVDSAKGEITLQAFNGDKVVRFTVKIIAGTQINRQMLDAGAPNNYKGGLIPQTIKDLQEKSTINVFSQEDPTTTKQLTARQITIIM